MLCPPSGPAMSAISTAFGGKADMSFALHMSAFDIGSSLIEPRLNR